MLPYCSTPQGATLIAVHKQVKLLDKLYTNGEFDEQEEG